MLIIVKVPDQHSVKIKSAFNLGTKFETLSHTVLGVKIKMNQVVSEISQGLL